MHAAGHVQGSARFERLVEEPSGHLVVQDRIRRTVAVMSDRVVTFGIWGEKTSYQKKTSMLWAAAVVCV